MNEKILLIRGIIRICGNCDFKTTSRTEMRLHERTYIHFQDRSIQEKVIKK